MLPATNAPVRLLLRSPLIPCPIGPCRLVPYPSIHGRSRSAHRASVRHAQPAHAPAPPCCRVAHNSPSLTPPPPHRPFAGPSLRGPPTAHLSHCSPEHSR